MSIAPVDVAKIVMHEAYDRDAVVYGPKKQVTDRVPGMRNNLAAQDLPEKSGQASESPLGPRNSREIRAWLHFLSRKSLRAGARECFHGCLASLSPSCLAR